MGSEIDEPVEGDIHLSAGGGRLEAQWIGPRPDRAPTLIFLHEGLGCLALWRDFPARLAGITGCGALVYSRLGYGGSDACPLPRSVDFMHREALTVLPEVIQQTGIREYLLIGHSDGGSIALIHAGGTSCAGLKGLVTLAAHVFCEDLTLASIRAARERYLYGNLKQRLLPYHGQNTDGAFWGWNDVWLDPDFRRWTIADALPAIRVPVLAIQGQDDPYGTAAQIEAIQRLTGSQVEIDMIPGCGHAPHAEHLDAVVQRMCAFVAMHVR
ncbi:MAG: alpha/beta hydrolase [Desulfosarcina sp.]